MISQGNNLRPFQTQVGNLPSTLGDPNLALAIASIIAIYLLWSRLQDIEKFKRFLYEALTGAGIIILITSAGSAFGNMMQQTGVGIRIEELLPVIKLPFCPLHFLLRRLSGLPRARQLLRW